MQVFCPKCGQKNFKIVDKRITGASLLLIFVGLVSGMAIIAAAIVGDVFILGGIVGLGAFVWTVTWFARQRFVYECRNCGQKIRVNLFRIS